MTIQLQTTEESAAANAEIVKLEAAAQTARAALREHDANQNPRYPTPGANVTRTKLQSEVATADRALVSAQNIAHNQTVYDSLLSGYAANTARIAAEKAVQQANESEAQLKVRAESAYLAAGGTALGFAGEWPSLRAEVVRQKTLATLSQPQPVSYLDEYIAKRNAG